jgi:hypothetical protein
MLRLIKLAVYTLAGYAVYEFVRGMTDMPSGQQGGGGGGGGEQRQRSGGQRRQRPMGQTSQPNLSSSAEPQSPIKGGSSSPQGMNVETADNSGATITERVGRGVIPQT